MNSFEIRPVTEGNDLLRYRKLCTQLYRSSIPEMKDEEAYRQSLEEKQKNLHPDHVLLGAFEGGTLYAALDLIPYSVNIGGTETGMSGIGGVIADPAVSGRGMVKALMREAFHMMREQGRPVSHLYPFETGYYRRYGYEVSCAKAEWNVPVSYFRTEGIGTVRPFDNSDEMKEKIRAVGTEFAKRYEMSVIRNDNDWNAFFEIHRAYTSGRFSYLHETDGKADAFLTYQVEPRSDRTQDLRVPYVWYTSLVGLRELFSYFKTQIPYADRILLTLPTDTDLSGCVELDGGWGKRNTECRTTFMGISRAVDCEKLLALTHSRRGAGERVTLRIRDDDYCPWNNGFYTVTLGEKPEVTKTDDPDMRADIELTPRAFAAMYFGRYHMGNCQLLPGVTVNGNTELLGELFYPKCSFIDIHF